jgi:hypothetical protein
MPFKNTHLSSIILTLSYRFKNTELYVLQTVHYKTIYILNASNNVIIPFLSHYMITEHFCKSFNYGTPYPITSHISSSRHSVKYSMADYKLAHVHIWGHEPYYDTTSHSNHYKEFLDRDATQSHRKPSTFWRHKLDPSYGLRGRPTK